MSDDIRPYLSAADISVIPLRVGGGTRIKAFESMAVGRPVVSTAIGIEGLDLTQM
ncbi:MAG: glycosyltransferase family 4 protein [Rhodospirillales bacterium]